MKFLEKYLIGQMFKSKKFWYAVSSIVVPALVKFLGEDLTFSQLSGNLPDVFIYEGNVYNMKKGKDSLLIMYK